MDRKDIAIQFVVEARKTSNKVESFDPETGLLVFKLPINTGEVCSAVRAAIQWLLSTEDINKPALTEIRKYIPSFDSELFDVSVRIAKPQEDFVGWSTVDATIRDTQTLGSMSVVLYSHTVVDVYSVVDGVLQTTTPGIIPSLFYFED